MPISSPPPPAIEPQGLKRTEVVSGVFTVSANASVVVQPPSGETWVITHAGSVDGPVFVELYDGTNASPIYRGWRRTFIVITNSLYLRMRMPATSGYVGYTGFKAPDLEQVGQVWPGAVQTQIVRPPVGETWIITEIGGEDTYCVAELTDGTTYARIFQSLERAERVEASIGYPSGPYMIALTNSLYMQLDTSGQARPLGYCGYKLK